MTKLSLKWSLVQNIMMQLSLKWSCFNIEHSILDPEMEGSAGRFNIYSVKSDIQEAICAIPPQKPNVTNCPEKESINVVEEDNFEINQFLFLEKSHSISVPEKSYLLISFKCAIRFTISLYLRYYEFRIQRNPIQ